VRETRSSMKVHSIAVGLAVTMSALVISALFLVLLGGHMAPYIDAKLHMGHAFVIAWKIIQSIAALFFIVFAFSLIYYFGPDVREQHWYWITPGSLIGVLLWITASFAFRLYLHYF